eukprot:11643008-Karenia_brevis.AAC.1
MKRNSTGSSKRLWRGTHTAAQHARQVYVVYQSSISSFSGYCEGAAPHYSTSRRSGPRTKLSPAEALSQ